MPTRTRTPHGTGSMLWARSRHDSSSSAEAYPDLELEDIREALRYAAEAVRE